MHAYFMLIAKSSRNPHSLTRHIIRTAFDRKRSAFHIFLIIPVARIILKRAQYYTQAFS